MSRPDHTADAVAGPPDVAVPVTAPDGARQPTISGAAAPETAGTPASRPVGRPRVLSALVLLGVLAVLVAVVGVFYLPWWIGSVPVPWSVLPVAVFAWWAPRQGHRLTGSVLGAAVPILVWFVVTAWLSLSRNSLYAGYPIAVQDWRLYLLVGVGVLVAAWGIGGIWGRATLERAKAQRAALQPSSE